MPLPLACLFGLSLGASLGLLAARAPLRGDEPWPRSAAFAAAVCFGALLWGPASGYFVAFHGDWAYLYGVAFPRVPSAVDLLGVVAAAASVPAGFAATLPLRRVAPAARVALAGGPATLALALAVLCHRRLGTSATYAQYHGRFGCEPVFASALGQGILWMGLVCALGFALAVSVARGRAPGRKPR